MFRLFDLRQANNNQTLHIAFKWIFPRRQNTIYCWILVFTLIYSLCAPDPSEELSYLRSQTDPHMPVHIDKQQKKHTLPLKLFAFCCGPMVDRNYSDSVWAAMVEHMLKVFSSNEVLSGPCFMFCWHIFQWSAGGVWVSDKTQFVVSKTADCTNCTKFIVTFKHKWVFYKEKKTQLIKPHK